MMVASPSMHLGVATLLLVLAVGLMYRGRGFWTWVLPSALALGWWATNGIGSGQLFAAASGGLLLLAAVFGVPAVRRQLVTRGIMPARPGPRDAQRQRRRHFPRPSLRDDGVQAHRASPA